MPPPSILIIGCGVAGPTLATFLLLSSLPADQKPHITILERSSSARAQGQNVDIRGAGVEVIRKLGLEGIIRTSVTGEEGAKFVDRENRVWAAFGADKSGKTQTGTSDIEILRGKLANIFYLRSKGVSDEVKKQGGKGIEYIFGDYAASIEQDGEKAHVTFTKSKQTRSFDIVVGADGLQSRTRKMVFGESTDKSRIRKLDTFAGFFSMPKSETDSQWRRWFIAPGRRSIMVRPSDSPDMVTVLMLIISESDKRLEEAAVGGRAGSAEEKAQQKALLAEYFADSGWECPRIIREMHASEDFYYDEVAQVQMEKWNQGRVVLLGDAAYCASPISGMGTTLGLSGAYNLAGAISQQLSQHGGGRLGDYPAVFEQYESAMRPLVDRAQRLPFGGPPRGMPHLFHPETAWGVMVMHLIMAFIYYSGIAGLAVRFGAGPPAGSDEAKQAVKVGEQDEFGFRKLPEVTKTELGLES